MAVDAETGEVVDDQTTNGEIVQGDDGELTLFPGGPKPLKAVLKLKAGKKDIGNELHRGDEIALLVHARIDEISFSGDNRIHVATILDIFEHDTGGADVGTALMGTTSSPLPSGEADAEDAEFERGEDQEEQKPAEPASDEDLDWN